MYPLDLHEGFRDPRQTPAGDLMDFLEAADRLPSIRAIQHALRRVLDLRPGMRLLDAGCGIGLETRRLAAAHPETLVTGLDRNADLLAVARRSADPATANLGWLEADLAALDLPAASFDAIRTDRVLMYLPDGGLERALAGLIRVLRPGGRLALFELDYGATILALGATAHAVVDRAVDALRSSLPQPLAGRRLPALLSARGLRDVTAEPFSIVPSETVWRRIVHDTITASGSPGCDPDLAAWLRQQAAAAARGEFVAAFTGVLTSASKADA
jgi:ubiquinone/menaquinone biosynthesis C-methylase UbiE